MLKHFKLQSTLLAFISLFLLPSTAIGANNCQQDGVWLQVLGSGGPELTDQRNSSSYLIWQDGKAKVMLDAGPGSLHAFEQSGADFNDIDIVLFSHFHVDHSAEFPAYIKGSFFTGRSKELKVFGPKGNAYLPSTEDFIQRLFGNKGLWPYLQAHLVPNSDSFYINGRSIDHNQQQIETIYQHQGLSIKALGVNHGPLPAIAYQLIFKRQGKTTASLSYTGDSSNKNQQLNKISLNSHTLLAHHAINEQITGVAKRLHMSPSQIGKLAKASQIKQLVLSHRMRRSLGHEAQSLNFIRRHYPGVSHFGDNLDCFALHD